MWFKFIMMILLSFVLFGCKTTGEITQATPIPTTATVAPAAVTVPLFEDDVEVYNLEDVETTVTYGVADIQPSSNFMSSSN